jgi:WXG100 family type VII secretion target
MRIGANIESMNDLRTSFTNQAQAVTNLTTDLQGKVDMIQAREWEGPAADRFASAWNSEFRTALNNLRTALDDAATEVHNRAQAIQQAGS